MDNENTKTILTAVFLSALVLSMGLIVATPKAIFATTEQDDEDEDEKNNDKVNAKPRNSDVVEDRANENSAVVRDNDDEDEESDDDNAGDSTDTSARTASISAAATASTDTLVPEFQQAIVTTVRQPSVWLNILNNVGTGNAAGFDPGDGIVLHANPTQTPAQLQPWADMAKQVNGITDNNICYEVNSVAQIQSFSQDAAAEGFGCIYFDLEPSGGGETHSPADEVSNPVNAFTQAKAAADAAGIELGATPSRSITMSNGTNIAPLVTLYHLQSQGLQGSDTTCAAMKNFVVTWEQNLRSANPALNGKISYQVSASGNAATGKTVYATMQDCVRAVSPTAEDGGRVWSNGPFIDGTSPFAATTNLKSFLTFFENGWSTNNPN